VSRLQGKVAIVTGSASGIGRATAIRLAKEGAKVVVVTDQRVALGQETVDIITADGGVAAFVQADVGVAADVEKMVQFAVDTYGRLDILVNNAARGRGMLLEMSEEDWDRVMDVCLKSVWLGAKAAYLEMIKVGGGSIINISSVNAVAASPGSGAYNAAKGGVNQLTRALAVDLGKHNIRVNAVLPGHVGTHPQIYENDPSALWSFTEACPIGRIGTAEDIAGAVLYLASDDAAWVTGSMLTVDGGMTAQVPEILIASSYRRRHGRKPVKIDE
jgi:NAD(P)-dependent dehydrogenase (short-subunit alcohol dehydrogenase family)